jgi:heme exporter protein D
MSDTAGSVRALNCTNCGGPLQLRAAGYTTDLVCFHCGSTLDATDPDLPLIQKAAEALRQPEISLGKRAKFDGIEWEAGGYLERTSGDSGWSEYLLFNPYHGYRFLIDDGRRFSLGEVLDRAPEVVGSTANLDGKAYSEFGGSYWARVQFVVGEFYWRVAIGEAVQVEDYVLPGTILSHERTDTEQTWTRARMLEWGVAEKAFGIAARSPGYAPPSAHEASLYGRWFWRSLVISVIAILALLVASVMFEDKGEILLTQDVPVQMDGQDRTAKLGPLILSHQSSIAVKASPFTLDNAWIDLDYSLVDRRTQESYDVSAVAENYYGQDSDGPWREGNAVPETRVASIPAGTYDLVVTIGGHTWLGQGTYFSAQPAPADGMVRIAIQRGASFPENYWTAILLMLIWPGMLLFLHYQFEKRRRMAGEED